MGGGGGGDIDIYVVHYVLCTVGSSGIRAVQYLVHILHIECAACISNSTEVQCFLFVYFSVFTFR